MGTIIDGRYQIKKSLPDGNMSTVFLCNDIMSDDNEIVAVKVFNKEINGANTELQNKIFYREVESLERADHLNIVKIIDKGYDEKLNSFYIVLEYDSGKNLGQLLILRILKTGISLEAMPPWVSENGFSSFQAVC